MLPELLKFGASGNVIVVLTVVLGSTGHYSDDVEHRLAPGNGFNGCGVKFYRLLQEWCCHIGLLLSYWC